MGLWQFRVFPRLGQADPVGQQALGMLRDFGITSVLNVRTARLFTINLLSETDSVKNEDVWTRRIAKELVTDRVTEICEVLRAGVTPSTPPGVLPVEVHYKPGVMDNVANSTALALADMGIGATSVRTARLYLLDPIPAGNDIGRLKRLLGNECVEEVFAGARPVGPAPTPPDRGFELRHVEIRRLDASALNRLSRERHLFLSTEEMQGIQRYFGQAGREPTDLEVETLAQTWSEHCVHKTLTSAVEYRGAPFPLGGDRETNEGTGSPDVHRDRTSEEGDSRANDSEIRQYDNLLKDTIARATHELIAEKRGPTCLSVFKDNAGVIAFDEEYAIAFKVETHNHPSAIEPYGGAATGIGGVIRDVLGCGLGAKPIANTDVFCVAPPDWPVDAVPRGVIHPRCVLKGIVAGVRDYGNRMGIPTVNGAVQFDPRYLGNPLVYCGCIGLIRRDRIEKRARAGDVIIVLGGRTGRDGIHGATFSSAELTDTHVDEFAHAVQIGNAIEEKKVLDVILQARDYAAGKGDDAGGCCLYSAITDCGAGGLSSAVGEMGAEIGAEVELEAVPLKYAGLRYDEIWISEAQERMVLAVPPANVETFLRLAAGEDVEATVIGRFTETGRLVVRYAGTVVGDLDMRFLHHGVPKTRRQAEWQPDPRPQVRQRGFDSPADELKRRLGDPNTASKHWIIRQYDHEVQGRSVIKPLVGKYDGPSDGAVLRPRLDSNRGLAIACGLAPDLADIDPYWMAVAAIDEALRNIVCVGGNPERTAILDNFCWPRVDDPRGMGALVRACQACYDAAKAYGLPFISGKDSLNNEFAMNEADAAMLGDLLSRRIGGQAGSAGMATFLRDNRLPIPHTLLISAISLIDDVATCVTMDFKQERAPLYLVGQPSSFTVGEPDGRPAFDLSVAAATHRVVARMICERLVRSVHDVSDGGLLAACAEMSMAGGLACAVDGLRRWNNATSGRDRSPRLQGGAGEDEFRFYFEPSPALYVVEVANDRRDEFVRLANSVPSLCIGTTGEEHGGAAEYLELETRSGSPAGVRVSLASLRKAWRQPLDW